MLEPRFGPGPSDFTVLPVFVYCLSMVHGLAAGFKEPEDRKASRCPSKCDECLSEVGVSVTVTALWGRP